MKRYYLLILFLFISLNSFAAWDSDGVTAANTVAQNTTVIDGNFQAIESGTAYVKALYDTGGTGKATISATGLAVTGTLTTTSNLTTTGNIGASGDITATDDLIAVDDVICSDISASATIAVGGTIDTVDLVASDDITARNLIISTGADAETGINVTNAYNSKALNIDQSGILASGENSLYVASGVAQTAATARLVHFAMTSPASTRTVLYITQTGSGDAIGANSGAALGANGVWADASSRSLKENFKDIKVLDKLMSLPVQQYNYKIDSDETHISPCAEDFYKMFGAGRDTTLAAKDVSGVAIRAIQELNEKVIALEKRVKELEASK